MELEILLPCSDDYTTQHHHAPDKSSPHLHTILLRYILILISHLHSVHSNSVFLTDFVTKILDALLISQTYYMQRLSHFSSFWRPPNIISWKAKITKLLF
jgi:hypothetical protein